MLNSFKETYSDLFRFLRKPSERQGFVKTKSHRLKSLIALIAFDIPLMGILMLVINGFAKLGLVDFTNHQMQLLLTQLPIWLLILLVVVFIPFIEELIFRFSLRYKRNYFFSLIVIMSSIIRQNNKYTTKVNLRNFWYKWYPMVFYLSAITFGVVHLSNYELSTTAFFIIPILILPQLLLGLLVGYLRVCYNFMLGYFLHALHNTFFIVIALNSLGDFQPKVLLEYNNNFPKIETNLNHC